MAKQIKTPKDYILIKGAQMHNLKNIDVDIPKNKLVVITGLSGSGKSSLAFDTLYAEGQRRYLESLSSYARQFLDKLDKPKVKSIEGLSPAIAIEQKVNTVNPRSTVGTTTEIYDYMKLLFARAGITYSPISGDIVKKHSVTDVVDYIKTKTIGDKLLLLSEIKLAKAQKLDKLLEVLLQQGFVRIMIEDKVYRIGDDIPKVKIFFLVVDRIIVKDDEDFYNRLGDSVQISFYEGKGKSIVYDLKTKEKESFSNKFELDGLEFIEPNIHLFSSNNPLGACRNCDGFGSVLGIDRDLVIPNKGLSIYENAIVVWSTPSYEKHKFTLIEKANDLDIPVHKPWHELTKELQDKIWYGTKGFIGVLPFFKKIEAKNYKIQNRVMLSRYRGRSECESCKGKKLRIEASYVKVNDKSVCDLVDLSIDRLSEFFEEIKLSQTQLETADRLMKEIKIRLGLLKDIGLGYLTLNRLANSLSGGESQRINIATSIGSSLVGSTYILDEPSIGLHAKDSERLIKILKNLRDLGNTVVVVEHDEDIMKQADYIIDIGPESGINGGHLVGEGKYEDILKLDNLTSKYLNKELNVYADFTLNDSKNYIELIGVRENNLKNFDIKINLNGLTVVTGVSGSGKSTLIKKILYPALQRKITGYGEKAGEFTEIKGEFSDIKNIEFVDQNPIGRSSRSNPVTYTKAYVDIRRFYSSQPLSDSRNYTTKYFSFNTDGGRCDQCKGEGTTTVEMQFMADIVLECEHCKGQKFKEEVLEVRVDGNNIHDVLNMTVDQALKFFGKYKKRGITKRIQVLSDVGLGYIKLGQPSSTLSGGEAQRIKLATFLIKGKDNNKTLFLFDEPSTGLHFHDINKLLKSFKALIDLGHAVIVIEHNMDVIKNANYIVDLGPEGGENGGELIYSGTYKGFLKDENSYTAEYLRKHIV